MRNRKTILDNNVMSALLIIILLVLALFGLFFVKDFTGYVGYALNATAGYIYTIVISHTATTSGWGGYYGTVTVDSDSIIITYPVNASAGNMTQKNLVFDCSGATGSDIYLSTVDTNDLVSPFSAATIQDINDFMSFTGTEHDSANKTFTVNITVNLGGINITGPGTYTRQSAGSNSFDLVALKDNSGNLLFGTHETYAIGFDGVFHEYQIMVPVPTSGSYTYYFLPDPVSNPLGSCATTQYATVQGVVTDNFTGALLQDVSIDFGVDNVTTDVDGSYSGSIVTGEHNIVATKIGYVTHYDSFNVVYGIINYYNFTMIPAQGMGAPYGYISGFVIDNSTGQVIANATVTAGGDAVLTDDIGNYSVLASIGNATLVAIKSGYNAYVKQDIVVKLLQITSQNITMTLYVPSAAANGIVQGMMIVNSTNLPIADATVYLGGINRYVTTDSIGNYSVSAPADNYFIVAEKSGYQRYVSNVTLTSGNIIIHNITMLNKTIAKYKTKIYENITKNIPKLFNFSENISTIINLTINTTQQDIYVQANLYESKPEGVNQPTFSNLGNYYEFTSNINTSVSINVTLQITYNESDIAGAVNESYLTIFYFNPSTMVWEEQNATVDSESNIVTYSTDHFSMYILGIRNPKIYGTVTSGSTALDNVTVFAGGEIHATGASGDYSITVQAGSHDLIAVKSGYDAYISSFTIEAGERLERDIAMTTITTATATTTAAAAASTAASTSAAAAQAQAKDGTGGLSDYHISVEEIKEKITMGSFFEKVILFYNLEDHSTELYFSIEGEVASFAKLDRTGVSIEAKGKGEVKLTLLGINRPGFYIGSLVVSGGIERIIPIKLTIYDREKLPISALMMKVELFKRSVTPGGIIRYKVDLRNLLVDKTYDVFLKYTIRSIDGNKTLDAGKQETKIQTFTSVSGDLQIPDDLELGDYVLDVEANYLDYTSTTSTVFAVTEPFYQYRLYGVMPVWLLASIIAFLANGFFVVKVVKKRQEKKKRFHAEIDYKLLPQEDEKALFIGNLAETNKKAFFDMDKLTTHTIVAGSTGGGKTIAAQGIIEECLMKNVAVIVFDPTAQWSGMLRKCEDKKMMSFYPQFGLKPSNARAFSGNIRNIKDAREVIDLTKYMKPGEIQILTVNKLDPKDLDMFVGNTVREIFSSKLEESSELKVLIVYDEVHRLLPKFGGSGQGMLQIERACREVRKWGIGIMLISQVLADFVGQIKANINTEVQMKTRDEGDLNRINMKYGEEFIHGLVKAPVGSGMIQNSAFNRGTPYYVTFRPILHSVVRLEDEELDKYNKYNTVIDDIEYQFEQLEELKQDVFDLKLELKLCKDKIKSGNFNMVQIYLDGLTPRVQKVWDKIGKKPKKKELKLIDENTLKVELEKAKKARAEYDAQQKAAGVVQKKEKKAELKEKTSEEVETSLTQIDELVVQIEESITRKDKDRALELYNELPPIITRFPKDKKAEQQKKFDELKSKIDASFEIKKPEEKKPETAPAASAPAPPEAAKTESAPVAEAASQVSSTKK